MRLHLNIIMYVKIRKEVIYFFSLKLDHRDLLTKRIFQDTNFLEMLRMTVEF